MKAKRLYLRVQVLILGSVVFVGCQGSNCELALPYGLDALRVGMTEAELLRIRPLAKPNISVSGFEESLDGHPFVSKAEYHFEDEKLRFAWIGSTWQNDDHTRDEMYRLLPGFVGGAIRRWGQPDSVGIVSTEFIDKVVLQWECSNTALRLRYPNPRLLRREPNAKSSLNLELVLSDRADAAEDNFRMGFREVTNIPLGEADDQLENTQPE